jgi:hypothetical protein
VSVWPEWLCKRGAQTEKDLRNISITEILSRSSSRKGKLAGAPPVSHAASQPRDITGGIIFSRSPSVRGSRSESLWFHDPCSEVGRVRASRNCSGEPRAPVNPHLVRGTRGVITTSPKATPKPSAQTRFVLDAMESDAKREEARFEQI